MISRLGFWAVWIVVCSAILLWTGLGTAIVYWSWMHPPPVASKINMEEE
jgi:hypothetical protein